MTEGQVLRLLERGPDSPLDNGWFDLPKPFSTTLSGGGIDLTGSFFIISLSK
jgi:hypothetical protein